MQREVLRPQLNTPLIVRLDKGPEGIQREGNSGIDFQYTCNEDTGIMWLPKEAREKLIHLGAEPGDEVAITKKKLGRGVAWEIELVEDEPAQPPRLPRVGAHRAVEQQNTTAAYIKRNSPQPATQPVQRPAAVLLAGALYAAIDAAISAEVYASSKGRALELCSDDIRAMAISLYIDARKEVR
jgi:hypothetical protein